jgi:hypothetical protein
MLSYKAINETSDNIARMLSNIFLEAVCCALERINTKTQLDFDVYKNQHKRV